MGATAEFRYVIPVLGGSGPEVQGHPRLHRAFRVNPGFLRHYHKTNKQKEKIFGVYFTDKPLRLLGTRTPMLELRHPLRPTQYGSAAHTKSDSQWLVTKRVRTQMLRFKPRAASAEYTDNQTRGWTNAQHTYHQTLACGPPPPGQC